MALYHHFMQERQGGNYNLLLPVLGCALLKSTGVLVMLGRSRPHKDVTVITKIIPCSDLIQVRRSSHCQLVRVWKSWCLLIISLQQKNTKMHILLAVAPSAFTLMKAEGQELDFSQTFFHKVVSTFFTLYFSKGKSTILLTLDLFIFSVSLSTCSLLTIQHAASPDKSS